ncbi:N-acetyltransferase family protein [Sporomusa aerivorans]|uniref:GNAT family N-acetyltransferase n=1 Tax=Sporomusa aerivorans TaxID=204936 RepID=UPI00352AD668
MLTDIIVRKARTEDIGSMVELIAIVFSVEEDFAVDIAKQRRGLELILDDPASRCLLVAEFQQKVIGMCSAQLLVSTAEGGWKALVEDVVVAKEFQGWGIGRQMLAVLEKWALDQGIKRLDLLADRDNMNGLEFYAKVGWRKTNLIALQKKVGSNSK